MEFFSFLNQDLKFKFRNLSNKKITVNDLAVIDLKTGQILKIMELEFCWLIKNIRTKILKNSVVIEDL